MGIKTELQNILETVNTYLDPELETQNELITQLKLAIGLIETMTIDGVNYQYEPGMTWTEWVESTYNTGEFYIMGSVVTNDGVKRVYTSAKPVPANYEIESGDYDYR